MTTAGWQLCGRESQNNPIPMRGRFEKVWYQLLEQAQGITKTDKQVTNGELLSLHQRRQAMKKSVGRGSAGRGRKEVSWKSGRSAYTCSRERALPHPMETMVFPRDKEDTLRQQSRERKHRHRGCISSGPAHTPRGSTRGSALGLPRGSVQGSALGLPRGTTLGSVLGLRRDTSVSTSLIPRPLLAFFLFWRLASEWHWLP